MRPDVVLVSVPVREAVQHRDTLPSKYLGLAYVAASLEAMGVGVRVVDARGERMGGRDVVDLVRRLAPRVVGFTAMTHEIVRAGQLARAIKDALPGTLTVVGGAHAIALPERTLVEFGGFDVACGGEGEAIAVEIWRAARGEGDLGRVPGIAWRDGDRVLVNACREPPRDLDAIARPAWHLFPATGHFPVYTARGCPYQCNFCMRALGSRYRARSVEDVVAEVQWLVERHGARSISFEDETFVIDRARTFRLLDLLVERGLHARVRWLANLHARSVDAALVTRMREAGCVSIGTGIESGNPQILSRIGKGLTVPIAQRAVATIREAGLEVRAFFIIGHPHETWRTAWDTIRLAAQLDPDRASFGIMVPYPGTEVARMVERGEGGYRLLSLDWADYDKYLGHALELRALSRPRLELLQGLAYLVLHVSNGRVRDLARFVFGHRRAAMRLAWKVLAGTWHRLARAWRRRVTQQGPVAMPIATPGRPAPVLPQAGPAAPW